MSVCIFPISSSYDVTRLIGRVESARGVKKEYIADGERKKVSRRPLRQTSLTYPAVDISQGNNKWKLTF